MTTAQMPEGLPSLVNTYEGEVQCPVRFRVPSWEHALMGSREEVRALLTDARYTQPFESDRSSRANDRTVAVARADLLAVCESLNPDSQSDVLAAFVLTMAWGSGVTGSRSLRNTARALQDPRVAHRALATAALTLRAARTPGDGAAERAHATFWLPGVRQAFFSKWFAFAGRVPERAWQPLILDSRVYATLTDTLGVTTSFLAGSRYKAARYAAYVEALHAWARDLAETGRTVTAERLEWVLFRHNGKPLPPSPDRLGRARTASTG